MKPSRREVCTALVAAPFTASSVLLGQESAPLPQRSGGLKGYISAGVGNPPTGYSAGVSFYAAIWTLLDHPLADFQIGLPSTWIIPDNTDFTQPLCPPGTVARDNWPERGPSYRDVFQTIEGGLGYWGSTQFGSTTPKYRINGTPDGYTHEISSPGWGFGRTEPLPDKVMGIAQLSNRLLVPPDGLTFDANLAAGQLVGNAWMALPLGLFSDGDCGPEAFGSNASRTPTGHQSWTLFLNTRGFAGPVAFWIPQTWSRLSRGYPLIVGRGLDARAGRMGSGAMEVNTVPCFEARDAQGVRYTRIPRLQFPADRQRHTVLMQDVTLYGPSALADGLRRWLNGEQTRCPTDFAAAGAWSAPLTNNPLRARQGDANQELAGLDACLRTAIFGDPGQGRTFGLEWLGGAHGAFPEYFREVDGKMQVVSATDVPAETGLQRQEFRGKRPGGPYTSPTAPGSAWTTPGPASVPFRAKLTDGSTVTYSWYRFVDQPSLRQYHLTDAAERRLQDQVTRIHRDGKPGGPHMPPPTSGELASLDPALLVEPPRGLEAGFVPIVTRQEILEGSPAGVLGS